MEVQSVPGLPRLLTVPERSGSSRCVLVPEHKPVGSHVLPKHRLTQVATVLL